MIDCDLYVNNVKLDLKDGIPIPLTYSIADIKEPTKRARDMSKTIVLPGTQINRQFFASAYNITILDLNQDGACFNFDPTLRYPAYALRNGRPIFHGFVNLQQVTIENEVPEFEIVMFSTVKDLFQALGDMTIGELGWSEYDHVLSIANIKATWSASLGSGYWYPLIDFGYTGNLLSYKTNDLIPGVYWKEIIEKCLEFQDLTLSSTHMNTTLFKRHTIVAGGGDKVVITAAEVNDRHVNYTGDGATPYPVNPSISGISMTTWHSFQTIPLSDNPFLTMTQVDDTLSQFNEGNGYFDIANSGKYRLSVTGDFILSYLWSTVPSNLNLTISFKCRTQINGTWGQYYSQVIFDNGDGSEAIPLSLVVDMDLNANDEVYVDTRIEVYANAPGFHMDKDLTITLDFDNDLVLDLSAINEALIDGDTVNLARWLPNIKAVDFFNDVIMAHNLYISEPNDAGQVKIEPITSYYLPTNDTDDWSDKKDKKKKAIIVPTINIAEGAEYFFRFAEDRDGYKLDYWNRYGIDYGDKLFKVATNFKKGTKLFQLKTMAQSVPVQLDGTNIIIPRIVTLNVGTGFSTPYKGKARCFLNNGEIACDDWDLVNSDTLVPSVQTTYPRAHHLDSLTSPTYDLMFINPVITYYTTSVYTTSNLYERFYQTFIREIASRDGKLYIGYFKLNEGDLYKDFMRRLANIDGTVWRKNKIVDFDITSNATVKCELIKVVEGRNRARTFTPATSAPGLPAVADTTTITTDTAARPTHKGVVADTSAGDVTYTYDTTVFNYREGQSWDIVKTGGNNLIIDVVGGQTLSGETSQTLRRDYDAVYIVYKQGEFYFN